jgi:Flp pilus assembly protein TadG
MRATMVAAILVACGALLVACGTSARQKQQARKPAQQVADAVAALQHDLSTRNYRDLCEQVFSAQAREQAGGVSCPTILARESQGIRNPKIEIKRIDVKGQGAVARVLTSAEGQAAVPETIQLVLENGRYRVLALAARSS